MSAVKPISGIQTREEDGNFMRQIHGLAVQDVWTKFLFEDNYLCYHIVLQIDSGETILYQEFNDYSEYKNTLEQLHLAISKDAVIKIPKKISESGSATSKVA